MNTNTTDGIPPLPLAEHLLCPICRQPGVVWHRLTALCLRCNQPLGADFVRHWNEGWWAAIGAGDGKVEGVRV
jgi:hypothetical protein